MSGQQKDGPERRDGERPNKRQEHGQQQPNRETERVRQLPERRDQCEKTCGTFRSGIASWLEYQAHFNGYSILVGWEKTTKKPGCCAHNYEEQPRP